MHMYFGIWWRSKSPCNINLISRRSAAASTFRIVMLVDVILIFDIVFKLHWTYYFLYLIRPYYLRIFCTCTFINEPCEWSWSFSACKRSHVRFWLGLFLSYCRSWSFFCLNVLTSRWPRLLQILSWSSSTWSQATCLSLIVILFSVFAISCLATPWCAMQYFLSKWKEK